VDFVDSNEPHIAAIQVIHHPELVIGSSDQDVFCFG